MRRPNRSGIGTMTKKRTKYIIAVLCSAGCLAFSYAGPPQKDAVEAKAVSSVPRVELARCRIRLKNQVELASDRVGILEFVEPEEGDVVESGQQIAGLQADVPKAQLAIATKEAENDIEVRYARKEAEVSKAEHLKAIQTNRISRGAVPEIDVLKLKLAAERSVLSIEQAQHRFEVTKLNKDQAEAELKTHQIIAPFDGVVTRVFKKKGEAVRQGDPILELSSTKTVIVEGDVDISDAIGLERGAIVQVFLDIPDVDLAVERKPFPGRLVFVDVSVRPVSNKIRVRAEVENEGNLLKAGLTARMQVFGVNKSAGKEREVK